MLILVKKIMLINMFLSSHCMMIQHRYELELPQQDAASCPECWIEWQVIDSAGLVVQPMRKQFYNLCQQSFWLAMQADGEDES